MVAQQFFHFSLLAWTSYDDSGRQKGRMRYVIVNSFSLYNVSHLSCSNVYQGTFRSLHVAAMAEEKSKCVGTPSFTLQSQGSATCRDQEEGKTCNTMFSLPRVTTGSSTSCKMRL